MTALVLKKKTHQIFYLLETRKFSDFLENLNLGEKKTFLKNDII